MRRNQKPLGIHWQYPTLTDRKIYIRRKGTSTIREIVCPIGTVFERGIVTSIVISIVMCIMSEEPMSIVCIYTTPIQHNRKTTVNQEEGNRIVRVTVKFGIRDPRWGHTSPPLVLHPK